MFDHWPFATAMSPTIICFPLLLEYYHFLGLPPIDAIIVTIAATFKVIIRLNTILPRHNKIARHVTLVITTYYCLVYHHRIGRAFIHAAIIAHCFASIIHFAITPQYHAFFTCYWSLGLLARHATPAPPALFTPIISRQPPSLPAINIYCLSFHWVNYCSHRHHVATSIASSPRLGSRAFTTAHHWSALILMPLISISIIITGLTLRQLVVHYATLFVIVCCRLLLLYHLYYYYHCHSPPILQSFE